MVYRGHVKDGVVVLDDPCDFPDGAEVEVQPVVHAKPPPEGDRENIPSLYERLKPIIGAAKGLPPDASINVDHYLYGHPKK